MRREPRRRLVGLRLEERVERALHALAMGFELAREILPARMAHRFGDERSMLVIARQRLGLLVVVVLQPVLEAAKERVGAAQLGRPRGIDEAALGDPAQRAAGGSRAQSRVAPAAHHLVELHDELDLADAAAADLDVVRLAAPGGGLGDARVQLAQRVEHAVVEIAAIDEGLDVLFHALRRAGHHARFQPRIALPGARVRDEIVLERRERGDERAAVAERAQAHVDAECRAFVGELRQERDHLAARLDVTLGAGRIVVVEEDEVHVGGDVELLAAQFAEPGHGERHSGRGHRRPDRFLGERRHGREHLVERREVVEVAMREGDHHAFAQAPKPRSEARGIAFESLAHLRARKRRVGARLQVLQHGRTRVSHSGDVAGQAKSAFEVHRPEATIPS